MATNGTSGVGLGSVAVGSILIYSGIKGFSVLKAAQNVIQGNAANSGQSESSPLTQGGTNSSLTSPAGGSISGGNSSANRTLGQQMASAYGWGSGAEWEALDWIATEESGWSDTVVNASSGAAGIAQRIQGFGPGYESGNASQQIAWMLSYIKGRYGDPIKAKAFHEANGYY